MNTTQDAVKAMLGLFWHSVWNDGDTQDERSRRAGEFKAHAERVAAELEQVERLRDGLRQADELASVAHDAIWASEVSPCGKLHDNDDPLSAQSAIWRLHEVARALLSASQDTKESGEAKAYRALTELVGALEAGVTWTDLALSLRVRLLQLQQQEASRGGDQ